MSQPDKQKEYLQKLERIGASLKAFRYTMRSVFGLSEQPFRERITEKIEQRRQSLPQQGNNPQIPEFRLGSRFLGFLQPPEQPPLSEEEKAFLEEQKLVEAEMYQQILEKALLRKQQEENERKRAEETEKLRRARERLSVEFR